MNFKKPLLFFGLAICYALSLRAQTPIQTQQLNTTYYVGQVSGVYPTIQSAVTAACMASGASVNIPAGAAPSDTISAVTGGCTTAYIVDQRLVESACYVWNGSPPVHKYILGSCDATGALNFVTANNTNGTFNTDPYRTGGTANDGLHTILGEACSTGSCTAMFPANSTSKEPAFPSVDNTHVQDFRNGSQGDNFYNPVTGGPGGINPYGANGSGAYEIQATWNDPNLDLTNGAVQTTFNLFPTFNGPGYYWGANYGPPPPNGFGVVGSPVNHGLFVRMTGSTPAITNMISSQMNTYHGGDVQSGTFYNTFDGGFIGGGDEGVNDFILHRDQNTTWFHGTVNAGATNGTQLLQTTYVAGSTSRQQYAVNGYMVDTTRSLGQFHTAGPTTQLAGYRLFTTPIGESLPSSSTAVGTALSAIPPPPNKISASTTTVFTIDPTYSGSITQGLFATGAACMVGDLYQTVLITSVSKADMPTTGQQTVTYTYSKPALLSEQPSLWQGGPCGDFEVPALTYLNGWAIPYAIVGATDATHIVGRLFSGASSPQAIPNNWNANTANAPLSGISVSGTTVTATVGIPQPFTYNGITGATISNATNSSFNGTTGTITTINGNQLQWTQTGPTGTSASASITLPQSQFSFYLYPGAEVVNPCTAAGCPLSPNSVQWAAGDKVENMLNPSQRGNAITTEETLNSPSFGTNNASIGVGIGGQGRGISGTYTAFTFSNGNPCTLYIGCGGLLTPPQGVNLAGPLGSAFSTDPPLDGSAVFNIRPRFPQEGGATSTNLIRIMQVNAGSGGIAGLETYVQPTGEFNFNALATTRIRASILSTGLGLFGDNPVALTSANSVINQDVLGEYAAFGNEKPLDASATIGAAQFIAGSLYAGALPPTTTGVLVVGTRGSTTYSYVAKSVTQFGVSLPSGTATTTMGNATLNATNFNAINTIVGKGSQSTNIYRITAPAGLICANVPNNPSSANACKDTGQATLGPLTANVDTSGWVTSAVGTFTSTLTVAGQNVCQANGTNCPAGSPIASVGTNGISQPDNSTIGISGGVLSTKGFTGTKTAGTCVFTIVNGIITNVGGC